jgi:hypothetical protein
MPCCGVIVTAAAAHRLPASEPSAGPRRPGRRGQGSRTRGHQLAGHRLVRSFTPGRADAGRLAGKT